VTTWLRPTLRIVRWSPLLACLVSGAVLLTIVGLDGDRLAEPAQVLASTITVIAGVAALHDPGRELVHAVPVSALHRLSQRLFVVAPGVAVVLAMLSGLSARLFPVQVPGPVPLAALGAVGVALVATLSRRIGRRAADVATCVLTAAVLGGVVLVAAGVSRAVAMPWWGASLPLLIGAVVVALVAGTRGVAA
jgi:hypothetical protein